VGRGYRRIAADAVADRIAPSIRASRERPF